MQDICGTQYEFLCTLGGGIILELVSISHRPTLQVSTREQSFNWSPLKPVLRVQESLFSSLDKCCLCLISATQESLSLALWFVSQGAGLSLLRSQHSQQPLTACTTIYISSLWQCHGAMLNATTLPLHQCQALPASTLMPCSSSQLEASNKISISQWPHSLRPAKHNTS